MHRIGTRYASYFNRTYDRRGYLFQGRYKSILVEEERHLKRLVRYVHLNPVRANLVKKPEHYRWSSHNVYMRRYDIVWLENDWVLSKFGDIRSEARRNFESFVIAGIDQKSDVDFSRGNQGGIVLGDDFFFEQVFEQFEDSLRSQVKTKNLTVQDIIHKVADVLGMKVEDFHGTRREFKAVAARGITALIVRDLPSISMKKLSRNIGRDPSALTRAANQIERRAKTDSLLNELLEKIRLNLNK